ncbi:GntR family transcriptional regulator [Gordonia sp. (in: high G+C Gram-positive bacteria)]|uniref:GntR family transcriptional regulator n=1 Tax=Gordonia sp. (in: high G+C Gram-positive bacteria) TaxID=84139 RepID=UPI0016915A21|nr:GntR family transcriptional regulator [Gordonia sp. (in: high G+C Gram-positive bacteria)]NLG46539.1 GntR family transcriptional regulator [Gordonia sp. (in: high G+C Gram-positive bacteria)]
MTYSSADRVYDEVKELILTCELNGGEMISEGEIAARCEVSRTPVREAFLRLAAEGWMRLYPKRGALIVPIGESEARDVLDARVLLEGHAMSSVVGDSDAVVALETRLRDNLARHRQVDPADSAEFARLDAEFHQLIVAAGRNELLSDFYTSLGERHRRMTADRLRRDATMPDRIVADHAALADVVKAADPERFAEMLAAHLAGVHGMQAR